MSEAAVAVTVLLVSLVLLWPPSLWCTVHTLRTVYVLFHPDDHSPNNTGDLAMRMTMIGTAFCSVCFLTVLLAGTPNVGLQLATLIHDSDLTYTDSEFKQPVLTVRAILTIVQAAGYVGQCWVLWERCASVFDGTTLKLSSRLVTSVRCMMAFIVLGCVLPMLIFPWVSSVVTVSLFIPAITGYCAVSCGTVALFMRNTMRLAGKHHSAAAESTTSVTEVALKLLVITVVAVSSTFTTGIIIVITQFKRPLTLLIIRELLFFQDGLVNQACLLCVFRVNTPIYHALFGRLHRWGLDFLFPDSKPSMHSRLESASHV